MGLTADVAQAYDWAQANVQGRKESEAELLDDTAGRKAGNAMAKVTAEGKSGNYADLARQIMDILCD